MVTEAQMVQIPSEAWRELMASVSVKGPGAPAEKDNSWGYGMPMGDRLLRLAQGTAPRGRSGRAGVLS